MSGQKQSQEQQPLSAAMLENVEAVDVSWLHHSSKADAITRVRSASSAPPPQQLQQQQQQQHQSQSQSPPSGRRGSTPSTVPSATGATNEDQSTQHRETSPNKKNHHLHFPHLHFQNKGVQPNPPTLSPPQPTTEPASGGNSTATAHASSARPKQSQKGGPIHLKVPSSNTSSSAASPISTPQSPARSASPASSTSASGAASPGPPAASATTPTKSTPTKESRRNSWISSLSSKFSSSGAQADKDGTPKKEERERGGLFRVGERGIGFKSDRRKSVGMATPTADQEKDEKARRAEEERLRTAEVVGRRRSRGSTSDTDSGNSDSRKAAPSYNSKTADIAASLRSDAALNPFSAWGGFPPVSDDPDSPPPPAGPSDRETRENTNANANLTPNAPAAPQPGTSPSRQPGFFHNALKKLSSPRFGASLGSGNAEPAGGACNNKNAVGSPRRMVMNVDQTRDRSLVPELKQSKLRRVAFCVDIEIAGTAAKAAEVEGEEGGKSTSAATKKERKEKIMERSEGDALKLHPEKVEDDGKSEEVAAEVKGKEEQTGEDIKKGDAKENEQKEEQSEDDKGKEKKDKDKEKDPKAHTRKQEKKKRSEEERKERKERKRRQAEMNGTIPLQFVRDDLASAPHARSPDQPTTDPVRIYRRCCSLRETGVLKRIVAEISAPSSRLADEPGSVAMLNLTNFKMKTEDLITFSDWLAVVPVRKLVLQNCGLDDETVRIILAALLATKPMSDVYRRQSTDAVAKSGSSTSMKSTRERFGAIQKLVLNDNPNIGVEGWKHISLFIHMSRTLVGIDLSGIPFPTCHKKQQNCAEVAKTFSVALQTRLAGNHLQELVLSDCHLSTDDVTALCNAARLVGLKRLGLANNALSKQALKAVVSYYQGSSCEGLDLGGNDLSGRSDADSDNGDKVSTSSTEDDYDDPVDLLSSTITSAHSLATLSLADCCLTPKMLDPLLRALASLPDFRFLDLSHNRALFDSPNKRGDRTEKTKHKHDAVALLRKYLPRMYNLRRIHLVDVSLSPDAAIALAEILPECRSLCHINILENPEIANLTTSDKANDESAQESACALYASLMVAVRISNTLFAIDIEVPSAESNEVVKALAEQIVAYSLWNLEQSELCGAAAALDSVTADSSSTGSSGKEVNAKDAVPIPDVLLHIVGTGDDDISAEEFEPAPNEDYVITGTGVVKALGVVLGSLDSRRSRSVSRQPMHRRTISSNSIAPALTSPPPGRVDSPIPSGASTPRRRLSRSGAASGAASTTKTNKKAARDMSKNLLNSARKIRSRLQIALVRLDQTGDDANYRRLLFLDTTLERMIGRFEDEFPDTRLQEPSKVITYWGHGKDAHGAPATLENAPAASATEPAVVDDEDVQDPDPFAVRLSRSNSNTSLHSRWLTSEEGRVHRVSQHVRRDILGDSDGRAADSSPREGDGADQDKQNMAVLALTPKDHQLRSIREKIKRLSSPSRPGSSRSASPFGSPRSSVGMLSPPLPPGAFPSGEPSQKQTSPLTNVPETMHSETSSESALSVAEADTDSRNADLDIQAMARSSDADDQALEDSLAELMGLKRNDPEGFERFKQSQIAAQINAGIREGNSSSTERGKDG